MLILAVVMAGSLITPIGLPETHFRFHKASKDHSLGNPFCGFNRQVFLTFEDRPSGFGKILKGDDDSRGPIGDLKVCACITKLMPDYDFNSLATENLFAMLRPENVRAVFFLRGQGH